MYARNDEITKKVINTAIMATLKVEVSKTTISRKGTCEVGIRLYHHHEKRLIETGIYVSKTEMTKNWTIRNELVKRKVKALLKDYNAKLKQLQLDQYDMNIDAVVNYIVGVGDVSVDIIQYGREWIKEHEDQKCSRNHLVALNAFIKFVGRESYMCNDISKVFMKSFEKWLGDKKTARSVYPQVIKRMFNSAKQRYNEGREENKVIKRTLEFYHPPHVEIQTEKRALPVDIVRAIANLPDDPEGRTVVDLARDVFTISFMLMGTNTIDLMECKWDERGNITYDRAKTKDRRPDHARIVISPHPLLLPLIKKYRCTKHKKRNYVFNFVNTYKDATSFNQTVNRGLKIVGEKVGVPQLQFYAARHSMATIAYNEAGIDKFTVHEMLNHKVQVFTVTNMYIRQDFSRINDANFRLINYVFEYHLMSNSRLKELGGKEGDFLTSVHEDVVTFRYYVDPLLKHEDGKLGICFNVAFRGQSRDIATPLTVMNNEVNSRYQIVSKRVMDECEALIDRCNQRLKKTDLSATNITILDVMRLLA